MDHDYEFRRVLLQQSTKPKSYYSEKLRGLKDFDIGIVDNGGTTALHLASEYGNQSLVEALLDNQGARGIILKGDQRDGDTAVHMAALGGNVRVLEALLAELGNINVDDIKNKHDKTPLHYAMGKGNVEASRYLIQQGASVETADATGASALHYVARGGKVELLELVKDSLAKRNLVLDVDKMNYAGLTALHYAAWHNKVKAIEWLLSAGADPQKMDLVEGGTPLHWAAIQHGNKEAVEVLMRAQVERSMRVFVKMKNQQSRITVLELMERSGIDHVTTVLRAADSNRLLDPRAFPEPVLVKYVVGYGGLEMNKKVKACLKYGTAKKAGYRESISRLVKERRLLDWAAKHGNKHSVKLLMWLADKYLIHDHAFSGTFMQAEGDYDARIATSLQLALSHGKVEFAITLAMHRKCRDKLPELIILMKESVLTHDFEDKPFAYWIFHEGKTEAYEKFFKAQSKNEWANLVNEAVGQHEQTALHWAVKSGRKDLVIKLCNVKECRGNIPDDNGRTPYWHALELRRKDIARELARQEDVRADLDKLYRDRQVSVDGLNAILLGAALIASITFAGFLQPPLGYSFNFRSTSYVPITKPGVRFFWVFNSLSFFFAIASALVAVKGVLPAPELYILYVIRRTLLAASTLLVFSIVFVLAAFATLGFSVLPPSLRFSRPMVVTASLGGALCVLMLIWFLKGLHSMLPPAWVRACFWTIVSRRASSTKQTKPTLELVSIASTQPEKTSRLPEYQAGAYYSIYPFLNDGLDALVNEQQQTPALD